MKPAFDIILDSGAFSAWRLGKEINLSEYCGFIKQNEDWIGHAVALDVINPEDPVDAAKRSFQNYKFMRRQGLRPVPVFHVGEPIEYLFRYLDAGVDYIGLSSSSIVAKGAASEWYALAWSYLVTPDGRPTVRAHAFGEGRVENLMAYPWYSADSTSWIYSSQNSGVVQYADSKRLSWRNDGLSTKSAPDLDQLVGEDREELYRLLDRLGLARDVLDRRGDNAAFVTRCLISAYYYQDLERRVTATCPITYTPKGFLLSGNVRKAPPVDIPYFKLHLVVGGNHTALSAVHVANHPNILASYYYINTQSHLQHLRAYMFDPTATVSDPDLPFYRHFTTLLSCLRGDHEFYARSGIRSNARVRRSGQLRAPQQVEE